jgi:hypothetical protein
MIPLDKNTLFSIFEAGDEEIYKEHGLEDQLNNPFVLMGMIVKGLENFDMMDMLYTKRYPEHYKNVRDMTKYKYYNKLYMYLERIDTKNFNEKYTVGDSFGRENCFVALENMLRYYEKIEQYEKCAVIKRYQTLLLDSLCEKE